LEKKDRVKVTVIFRGREMSYIDVGFKLMERITQEVEGLGTVEQSPTKEGLRLTMVIVPS
jgi:translation initiation factor IF-3